MNMYSSKVHIKRLTGAFFLADIQTMTSAYVSWACIHVSTNFTSNHVSQCVAKSVILEAWTFGYVAIIDSLTWHSILLIELMEHSAQDLTYPAYEHPALADWHAS